MHTIQLGHSDLHVTPICLGTMTFGEQVNESDAHRILQHASARGINFLDTAEMYAVPPKAATFNATETIIGNYFAANKGAREQWIVATKVAGPSRGMPWIRNGNGDLTAADIIAACHGSLKRLQTDVIDLYQIHWPNRSAPAFGGIYYQPNEADAQQTSLHAQLEALAQLVQAGKIKAVGLSNETPYGVHEFMRLAAQYNLPQISTVQNPYSLINRSYENGLDETMHRLGVSLLAYSPLAFGLLTGKYDASGLTGDGAPAEGRMTKFPTMRAQRWGRPEALNTARLYNQLARDNGLTPTQLGLAFCYQKWQVASTIIGVTSMAQLDECVDALNIRLSDELLQAIDAIRWQHRDPAQ
ncbi:aldo/keto reductase [Hydromonas duriensis]|uniref:Aryl-alcohol dehydrogenase-like predicted oxidoreductase n=1 Tax=Hydromonas duriensis TaxID=1527608 RepID=A0A4R6YA79_9BURK|nr:aldo/keto reductase [Hydromonas duriensis]TDR32377.1 aryl-alcohol dehydrogenase-like predicted oxidoreductase [Hydromonas duriensis]